MAVLYNPTTVMSGMVLCLDAGNPRSYPGTGTRWSDLSGNNNTATVTDNTFASPSVIYNGTTTFATIPNGTSTGVTQSFFKDPNPFYCDPGINGNTWSIQAWFRFPVAPTGPPKTGNAAYLICGMSGGIGGAETMSLFVSSGVDAGLAPIPYILCIGIRGLKTQISPGPVNTNTWNNVAVTWNGFSGRVYLNNVDRGALNVGGAGIQNTYFFGVGQTGVVSNTINSLFIYEGDLSNIMVYNRSLSAEEINQNYQALRGRYGV
jgi:hypothetical protein